MRRKQRGGARRALVVLDLERERGDAAAAGPLDPVVGDDQVVDGGLRLGEELARAGPVRVDGDRGVDARERRRAGPGSTARARPLRGRGASRRARGTRRSPA